jgi:hypothetical protein
MITHRPYPSDVTDAEWEFVVPYLCLLPEDAGQRVYNLRDVLDGLRWIVRTGSPWRYLPKDFAAASGGLLWPDPAAGRLRRRIPSSPEATLPPSARISASSTGDGPDRSPDGRSGWPGRLTHPLRRAQCR